MKQIQTILLALIILLSPDTRAQQFERFQRTHLTTDDGMLQNNVIDLAIDPLNICWFSYANGLQRYDGRYFSFVPIQEGLPDNKWVRFLATSGGRFLLSHSYGISEYLPGKNSFRLIWKNTEGQTKLPKLLAENNGILYFLSYPNQLIAFQLGTNKENKRENIAISKHAPSLSSDLARFGKNRGDTICISWKNTLFYFDLRKNKVIDMFHAETGREFASLECLSDEELIYSLYQEPAVIYKYKLSDKSLKKITIPSLQGINAIRNKLFVWEGRVLWSLFNRVFVLNNDYEGMVSELCDFNRNPLFESSNVNKMESDQFGNLYLVSIMDGVCRISNKHLAIKQYATNNPEAKSAHVLSLWVNKKANHILTGTLGNGLFIYDSSQNLLKHIRSLPGKTSALTVNAIAQTPSGEYLLACAGETKLWSYHFNKNQFTPIPIRNFQKLEPNTPSYFCKTILCTDSLVVISSQKDLYMYRQGDKYVEEWTMHGNNDILGSMMRGGLMINFYPDTLCWDDPFQKTIVRKKFFPNTGHVRCFAEKPGGNIFLGTNNGVFEIDDAGKSIRHISKNEGLPDDCIYAMAFDEEGLLWCSSNKGIFCINLQKPGYVFQLTREDGLQENEFNTGVVFKSGHELFFGGIKGANSFYPDQIRQGNEAIRLMLTRIQVNNKEYIGDSAVWYTRSLTLPYDKNNLAFDVTAMSGRMPGRYSFQYRMNPIDPEWVQNSDMQTIRYYLPPGKYSLDIYAGRTYDASVLPMHSISIIIKPPFWKTWWFYSIVGIVIFSLLLFSVNDYQRKKYQQKLIELESARRVQMEKERISRDLHDSIGAYANAVLHKTDLLGYKLTEPESKALMTDLRFASKDIIHSLRETIWALQKEAFACTDCLIRIRNFVQQLGRYYPDIQFQVTGTAPSNRMLENQQALNLVRMVQEAITNAIKHSGATHISVESIPGTEAWTILVQDDGSGFDEEKINPGYGLDNIRERGKASGIDVLLTTKETQGTRFQFTV